MSDPSDSSQLDISTTDAPINPTTSFGQRSVNLPLAIALPICLFVAIVLLVTLSVYFARRKKCSQKPVEPSMSRGSVEGSSDNGDSNNNNIDGETDNHQESEISTDGEILQVGGKPNAYDVSPRLSVAGRKIFTRNSEAPVFQQRNKDQTASIRRTSIDGQENQTPVTREHVTMEVFTEPVATGPEIDQKSQLRDTAIDIPTEEQGRHNFRTFIAVYSFEAENENQMSLVQNDIVLVAETEEHEGWLCGWKEDSSISGWFPKSHVREVEQYSSGSVGSDSTESDDDSEKDVRKYECRALYAFDGAEEGELSFGPGDILVVHHGIAETGWLYGQRGDEAGWFPETYVEVITGSNLLTSVSVDTDSTITTHHDSEALKTIQTKGLVVAEIDNVFEGSGSPLSPFVNAPCSQQSPLSTHDLETKTEDSTPSSVKQKRRSSIPFGKQNIADRLGLSKIKNFRRRKFSTDEPVTTTEVVAVPSPVSPRKKLHGKAWSATLQNQISSAGKKGKKEPQRPVISPPQAPRHQSLLKPHDQKREDAVDLTSDTRKYSSTDQDLTLPHTTNDKTGEEKVTTTLEYDASEPLGVEIEPIDDTRRTGYLASGDNVCVEVYVPKPLQSIPDDTKNQWDIALGRFDRILEAPDNFDEGSEVFKSLQLTPPQVNNRKTSEEQLIDRCALVQGGEASRKSELGLLSFAPPGFNDSEEVLSQKFLNYLSQVGEIDKSRLSYAAATEPPLRSHPPLPPKPSWPPTSDKKDEKHSREGGVSKDTDNDGTLTFIIQKGRSNRQSLSTLLLPDMVRGYITTDEYEHLQIPPPAGFSSGSEDSAEDSHEASLKTVDSRSNFHEIQTPRYFGRTLYDPPGDDPIDHSPGPLPDARPKDSEGGKVPFEVQTDTVVWKSWGHIEPKITRNSYVEASEARPRSRHETSSQGFMFKLADGSVVFNEVDVGLESVI